jgi:putative peptidoglycan lipid II flippase
MQLAFVFTLMAKGVGYTRQLIIAHSFGVSRDLDIYLMAANLTMLLLFTYTTWFDQLSVPFLIRVKEQEGEKAYQEMCGSVFTFSIVMAIVLTIAFLLLLAPASWLVCHGFTPVERARVRYMALYFVPWVLTIIPYNAMTSIVKTLRYYDAVLVADFGVSLVSTGGFALWHRHLAALPLFMSLGYILSLSGLTIFAWRSIKLHGPLWTTRIREMYRSFGRMFLVSGTYFFASGVERFFQSYLRPGAISAMGYAQQTLGPMSEFLLLDELYIVPLSSTEQRQQRLERLLKGMLLLTVPIACFLIWHASDIVQLLYRRGHFDARAQEYTTWIFRLMAINLISGTMCVPLIRILQITDNVYYSGYISLWGGAFSFVMNAVVVFYLKWDVIGPVATSATCSFFSIGLTLYYLYRLRMHISLAGVFKYGVWALASTGLAIALLRHLPTVSPYYVVTMAIQGLLFSLFIGMFYWPVRSNIKYITHG